MMNTRIEAGIGMAALMVVLGITAEAVRADPTVYAAEADFIADATVMGLERIAVEDFEENFLADSSTTFLAPPLASGIPNTGFPGGLDVEGLRVSGPGLVAVKTTLHVVSTAVGAWTPDSETTLHFDEGAGVFALRIYGGLPAPDAIEYELHGVNGEFLQEGTFETPAAGAPGGSFLGVISSEPVQSIVIRGFVLNVGAVAEYLDDVEIWAEPCAADLSDDGTVGFADLSTLLAAWGPCAGCPGDFDGDNQVGFTDLSALLAQWGGC